MCPETASEQVDNWEIATACDIKLGRHFQPGQPYESRVVSIDDQAIQQTIRIMGARTTATLLFTAADITCDEFVAGDLVLGAYYEWNKETDERKIAVGLNSWGFKDSLRLLLGGSPPSLQAKKLSPEKRLHKRTVHELRHAVDHANDAFMPIVWKEVLPGRGIRGLAHYSTSTYEKRARNTEREASSYPNIISID